MPAFIIIFLGLVAIVVILVTAAYASFRAAPWVPARSADLPRIVRLLDLRSGQTVYDFGAGDGRILLAVAPPGVFGVGFELSFLLYLVAWLRIISAGRRREVRVRFADFFHAPVVDADAIYCFLLPPAMKKLADKFQRECRPGTRIVTYTFGLPGWTPEVEDRSGGSGTVIYRYRVLGR